MIFKDSDRMGYDDNGRESNWNARESTGMGCECMGKMSQRCQGGMWVGGSVVEVQRRSGNPVEPLR